MDGKNVRLTELRFKMDCTQEPNNNNNNDNDNNTTKMNKIETIAKATKTQKKSNNRPRPINENIYLKARDYVLSLYFMKLC